MTTAPYYTMAEAAAKIGRTRERVGQLVAEGKLPHVTTRGGTVLIPAAAVESYTPAKRGRPAKS